jgi:biopolymer transport protein ExbB
MHSIAGPRFRWAHLLCRCLVAVAVFAVVAAAQPVMAQEAPAEGGGQRNLFVHIIISAGPIFGPMILLISIALVALVVLLMLELRASTCIPPAFVEEFADMVNKRKFKEAYELAKNDTSYLAQVISSGLLRLQYGLEEARDASAHTLESIRNGKDQLIAYLGTIGTLGPLIGLVGTVFGMILAFMKLSDKTRQANAADLADDISHALVVTMLGVALSLFAIFFHTFFKNRLNRVVLDTDSTADDLLTQMHYNSKRPAPPEGAKPAAAAAAPAAAAAQPVKA